MIERVRRRVVEFTALWSASCLLRRASTHAVRCGGQFLIARLLCGFKLILRKQQKLLGISISVLGVVLVNFSFSKKLVGFLSKPDVLSRVFPDSFPHLGHFLSFHVVLK